MKKYICISCGGVLYSSVKLDRLKYKNCNDCGGEIREVNFDEVVIPEGKHNSTDTFFQAHQRSCRGI